MTITIYQIMERTMSLDKIQKTIKNSTKRYKQTDAEGNVVELKTTIESIIKTEFGVLAIVKYDYLDEYLDRDGKMKSVIKSKPVTFVFTHGSGAFLLVFANQSIADKVVVEISKIAFPRHQDFILKCRINPADMEKFIKKHKPIILYTSWKEVRIPNLNNTSIGGKNIDASYDYKRYDSHGLKHSIRIRIESLGVTLSLNRNASLHFFSRLDENEQISFIREHILKLCK